MKALKKVLIIDDDSRNIFALSAVLRSRQYTCISATSAKQGLQLLHSENTIGVVLLDMMMPYMDGYEALAILKADAGLRDMPVIAVTAQAMPGDRERCMNAGASGYISKPVNVDKLLELLNHLM